MEFIEGFSKKSRKEKAEIIAASTSNNDAFLKILNSHLHGDKPTQTAYSELTENVLSNYYLPYSVAPNFLVNNKIYHIPMVIEESSVVAAASSAAKFWSKHSGFKAKVVNNLKKGHVHFVFSGPPDKIELLFQKHKTALLASVAGINENMKKRGGGIEDIALIDKTNQLPQYFQLELSFRTVDAMGANFINSVLEKTAETWSQLVTENGLSNDCKFQIIMSILSNYTPECLVQCDVETEIDAFGGLINNDDGQLFAEKFKWAVDMANTDISRATTHNKGIFNGVDAVLLATGNDFRAVEAAGHAFAMRNGQYRSLNSIEINKNNFRYSLQIPLAVGTVGGITNIHPMVKWSLDLLQQPTADELMKIVACAGMANNFSAIKSLVTSGIQQGHMRMHISNIFSSLGVKENEKSELLKRLEGKVIGFQAVRHELVKLRNQ